MLSISVLIAILLGIALVIIGSLFLKSRLASAAALSRYSAIMDVEGEAERIRDNNKRTLEGAEVLLRQLEATELEAKENHKRALEKYRADESEFLAGEHNRRVTLSAEYDLALERFNAMRAELAVAEDSLEDISFGIYQPHFTFQTTEEYRRQIEELRAQQKKVVRDEGAAQCSIPWTVNNSKVEGRRMVRFQSKLMLRAFNGECDAAIANLSWNNAPKMEERVRKAFGAINKLGDVQQIRIADLYLMLKVEELRMVQEFEQKRYEEREEQRRVREQIREEERAQREIDDALAESTSDEEKYAVAIAKARDEATQAMGAKLEKLTEQISKFEAKLDEARMKKERAIARAQLTKSGFVYVISNIGSFGDRVFKIGMTRRLEPMERIYELSGAAVPFPYDLHAMLFSDDAPSLEHELHTLFKDRRMNRVNARREFFQDVPLGDIEAFVKTKGLSAQFLSLPEAREYRQTLAMVEAASAKPPSSEKNIFPQQLFGSAS